MILRGKRNVFTAVLVLALLFTAAPGWAGQRRRSPTTSGWEAAWQRAVAWVAERAGSGLRAVWDKTSSQIDPNGQPQVAAPPTGTVQSDSSAGIDPDGWH